MVGATEHARLDPYVVQASNLLRNALGELQQAESILQKDKHLAGEPRIVSLASLHGHLYYTSFRTPRAMSNI